MTDSHIPREWCVAYARSRAQAKHRGEEWAFTLEQWYDMWQASGVAQHRGRRPHEYCMVRKDTIEAWGLHNCMIVSRRLNLRKHAYENMWQVPETQWQDRHATYVPPEARDD